jgi:ubiquinone/menaquinone biosynthesis C-methylase UbiE
VYRAHYALWVYWWPLWRNFSARHILRHWERHELVREGQTFLDYGCGTGDFALAAARKVSKTGEVYALDYFPRQLQIVSRRSEKAGLTNVKTILSASRTGLPDETVHVVWLCDVLHEIKERRAVLEELHRVLRSDGVLAVHDGMGEETLDYTDGLFTLIGRDGKFLRFAKVC